jgi:RHS repeat-associated protein
MEEGLSAEYRQSGSQAPQLYATHGWQPESQWGTAPLWVRTQRSDTQEVERASHHNDHLGTPLKSTDSIGAVVWSQKATSFGDTAVDAASVIENPLRFPGQYYDKETNTQYNYFRDYDHAAGRYTRADPIGLQGGLNRYIYGDANPISSIDANGLQTTGPTICNGTDCIDPPFDPSPDGPAPSPTKPEKKDPAYESWIDKCVDDACTREGWGWCRTQVCKWITKMACKRAGTNHQCCDCVKHACIKAKSDKGLDPEVAYVYCQSHLLLCLGGKGK